jgi:geranylgeranyl diphosphate synthase type II
MPTVHTKWNANIAILSGDVMLVEAYRLIMRCPDTCLREVLDLFNDTATRVCEGQQLDMNFETAADVSIPDYIHMIELKTSVLLAACLKTGALIAGASRKDMEAMYEFGRNTGIAFQLQDDILDVYGGAGFGKQVAGDIVSNKKTFLLIKAIEMADSSSAATLQKWLDAKTFEPDEKIKAVKDIYDRFQIRELAQAEAEKYFQTGMEHLHAVHAEASRKEPLAKFAEALLVREV